MIFDVLIGVAALALLWLLARLFLAASPAALARGLRWLAALLVAVAIGGFLYAGREGLAGALVPALLATLLRWRPRARSGSGSGASDAGDGRMTAAEALKILGLEEGASADQVREAHRRLMIRIHPDRGGSTFLAAKINEARDVLLGRV
jgi:hypothetical protein